LLADLVGCLSNGKASGFTEASRFDLEKILAAREAGQIVLFTSRKF
jgi:hypothetical protein